MILRIRFQVNTTSELVLVQFKIRRRRWQNSAQSSIACLYCSEELNSKWSISIIPAAGVPPVKTFRVPNRLSFQLSWTPDGNAIMYGLTRDGVTNLWLQSIEGGEPKQLTHFTSDEIHSFDISHDGKQLVFSRGTNRSDVVLFSGIKQ